MFCRRYGHAWKPVLAALILLITAAAGGLSIARRLEWHQISSDPPIWIFSGWTGGDIYNVELRIRPDCSSRPTRLLFPSATLVIDSATSTPAEPGAATTRGNIILSYDRPEFPVIYQPRLVRTVADDYPPTSSTARRYSEWSDYVDLAPGRETWFILRFPLPPMELGHRLRPKPETVPERFTIRLRALDLGCSVPVTLSRSFPLDGRELLLDLGPRAR